MDHEEEAPNSYELVDEMGPGVSTVVYAAICTSMDSSAVVINCIDLDCSRTDLDGVRGEVHIICRLSHHPNILGACCSFKLGQSLWLVKLFMTGDSLPSIRPSSFPYGFLELYVAVILRDTLSSLAYLRGQSHIQRDITVSNILVDSNGKVQLADFGISASMYGATAGAKTATLTAVEAQLERIDSPKRAAEGGQGEFAPSRQDSSIERSTMECLMIVETILDVHSRKVASMIALHQFMIYLFIVHLFHSNGWRG